MNDVAPKDIDWTALGFNNFLTKSIQGDPDYQTSQDFNSNVQDGAITNAKIKSASIDTAKIQDASITSAKIVGLVADKVTAGTISSQAITLGITAGTGDCAIKAGKTDFTNTETGFILGLDDSDSDTPKFYIGSSTKYINWDGSALTIRGTLNADDVTAGTLTGRTVQTASSGSRVVLNGSNNRMEIYSGSTERIRVEADQINFFDTERNIGRIYADSGELHIVGVNTYTGSPIVRLDANEFNVGSSPVGLCDLNISGHCLPMSDNGVNCGDASHRWALVRGVTITPGDLGWEEKTCHICGGKFQVGDKLKLVVKSINEDGEPMTVPIHNDC